MQKSLLAAALLVTVFTGRFATAADAPKAGDRPAVSTEKRLADLEARLEQMLKDVRELRQELAAANQHLEIVALRTVLASDAVKVLRETFPKPGPEAMADERTNSLVLRGTKEQIGEAKSVLKRLDK